MMAVRCRIVGPERIVLCTRLYRFSQQHRSILKRRSNICGLPQISTGGDLGGSVSSVVESVTQCSGCSPGRAQRECVPCRVLFCSHINVLLADLLARLCVLPCTKDVFHGTTLDSVAADILIIWLMFHGVHHLLIIVVLVISTVVFAVPREHVS